MSIYSHKKVMKKSLRYLIQAGVIAGVYIALSYAFAPLSFLALQFRISEALTLLPLFSPAAIFGLFIGCIISNLQSPFGIIDIIFGSLASLLAAIGTYLIGRWIKNRKISIWLAPIPPIIFNALIVGAILSYFLAGTPDAAPFYVFAFQVGLGQMGVCYVLGVPLMFALNKSGLFKD